jgi:hypothetical protein
MERSGNGMLRERPYSYAESGMTIYILSVLCHPYHPATGLIRRDFRELEMLEYKWKSGGGGGPPLFTPIYICNYQNPYYVFNHQFHTLRYLPTSTA